MSDMQPRESKQECSAGYCDYDPATGTPHSCPEKGPQHASIKPVAEVAHHLAAADARESSAIGDMLLADLIARLETQADAVEAEDPERAEAIRDYSLSLEP